MQRKLLFIDSIFIAQAGARKMIGQGYTYIPNGLVPGTAIVISPRGKRYRVHAHRGIITTAKGQYVDFPNFCNCPFALENGICKHQIFLSEQLDELEADNRFADEMTANMENADPDFCVDKIGM